MPATMDVCRVDQIPRRKEPTMTAAEPPVTPITPALRNLANKLLAKLWHCLQTNTPYQETSAWPRPETPTA